MIRRIALRPQNATAIALGAAAVILVFWTVFPFLWILLTSLKQPGDIISVPPKFAFTPTFDNYTALVMGEQHGQRAQPGQIFHCSS